MQDTVYHGTILNRLNSCKGYYIFLALDFVVVVVVILDMVGTPDHAQGTCAHCQVLNTGLSLVNMHSSSLSHLSGPGYFSVFLW